MNAHLCNPPVEAPEQGGDPLEGLAAYGRRLSPEAAYYWKCHQPRFHHVGEIVKRFHRVRPIRRVLDVGMGFETLLLRALLPNSRIECLGISSDERFRPQGDSSFHPLDLNDVLSTKPPGNTLTGDFDLIVFMEVLEHLYTPPDVVLGYLASHLAADGLMIVTTPNAAWLKHRLKMLCGKNPFETLRLDRKNMGHIREYTKSELTSALEHAGLEILQFERRGLYRFTGRKDRFYSAVAAWLHPSLCRTLVAICGKRDHTSG